MNPITKILLATLSGVVLTTELQAQLPNAWQITDASTMSGATLNYTNNLSPALHYAATNSAGGFLLSVNARFVTDFGGTKSMAMAYGLGTDHRFLIWFGLDGNDDLTVELEGQGPPFPVTSGGTGTAFYHTHEILYDGSSGTATYRFDGEEKATGWAGSGFGLPPGEIYWGAGSTTGRGQMNFNTVSFSITNELVASYEAGADGVPSVAPDPGSQGWTLVGSNTPPSAYVTNVSPDTALLPQVTTEAADQFMPGSVQLNGQVNPGESSALVWFEWGVDTNYGNSTGFIQNVLPGAGWTDVQKTLNNLPAGFEFNYRLVASNSFGIAMGTNRSFTLGFLQTTPAGLQGVFESSVAWGDYDNDGRLDFFLTGEANPGGMPEPISELWRNTGSGFSKVSIPGLSKVQRGSVAWGDYDNDGQLDFLLTGYNGSSGVSQLWRNTGSGFLNVTAAAAPGLPGVQSSSVAWGDYDNDGRLDFLLTGDDGGGAVSQLWRNTAGGFVDVTATVAPGVLGVSSGSVAWADYDNDGWLDLLLTGTTNGVSSGAVSQLWRNMGGTFTNVTVTVAPAIPRVSSSSVAWGDYHNDGQLDFLLTGSAFSQLWLNSGSGFVNDTATVAPDLPQVSQGSVAWGDFDNSGQLDFLVAGLADSTRVSQLWQRKGSGFTNATQAFASDLPGVYGGSVGWGDFDNDGRLDFLLTGFHDTMRVSQLWRNLVLFSNAPPAAPSGLAATVLGGQTTPVVLSWNASSDDRTPVAGLSYNLRVGTAPGGSDIMSPQALTNGFRLVPALGNAQMRTNALLNLAPGRYYWSVQAIDTAFAGGPFAAEASFTMPGPALSIVLSNLNAIVSWQPDTPGFFLQESSSLAPPAWTNSPSQSTNPVVVPVTETRKFYRLHYASPE